MSTCPLVDNLHGTPPSGPSILAAAARDGCRRTALPMHCHCTAHASSSCARCGSLDWHDRGSIGAMCSTGRCEVLTELVLSAEEMAPAGWCPPRPCIARTVVEGSNDAGSG